MGKNEGEIDKLRVRLIERVCRLDVAGLVKVESLLERLGSNQADTQTNGNMRSAASLASTKDWPHAPVHRLSQHGTFIVTASTLRKEHLFRGQERLSFLETELLRQAKHHEVVLEAWAVFSNHYHFVGHTTGVKNQIKSLLANLHSSTAGQINQLDNAPGRQVWFNFWDTQLTFERSYLARLNYVHQNAVRHRLVQRASDYRWCSAAWFERTATETQLKTIYSFKIDRIKIEDDYEPVL